MKNGLDILKMLDFTQTMLFLKLHYHVYKMLNVLLVKPLVFVLPVKQVIN